MEVTNLEGHRAIPYYTSCLSLETLTDPLNALLEAGLVDAEDGDAATIRHFADQTKLQRRADELVEIRIGEGDERLRVGPDGWDTFEALGQGSEYEWLEQVSIGALAERSGRLETPTSSNVELSKALGYRALEDPRNQPESQVKVMTGGPPAGGQLLAADALEGYLDGPPINAPEAPNHRPARKRARASPGREQGNNTRARQLKARKAPRNKRSRGAQKNQAGADTPPSTPLPTVRQPVKDTPKKSKRLAPSSVENSKPESPSLSSMQPNESAYVFFD